MAEYSERLSVRDNIELLTQGLDASPNSPALLYKLSTAFAAIGQKHQSLQAFQAAFRIDPDAALLSLTGPPSDIAARAGAIRDRTRALLEGGMTVSPVMAALAIAEGLLGEELHVKWWTNHNKFLVINNTTTKDNNLLAEEIRGKLKFYEHPAGRSIRKGWRRNNLNRSEMPATASLCRTLRSHVDSYIQNLPRDETHPFVASAPKDYVLEAWAVVSNGETHHESHIHQSAWLSGVYYVVQPPASRDSETHCGWLHIGPPNWIGPLPGWEEKQVEPSPGALVLMPAYFFHHTLPMGVDEERICVAFDVIPTDNAVAHQHT
jgi:hypothetical protein